MPHVLILGITESGKTTLAKRLCQGYRTRQIKTAVLDPLNDPEWNADYQTTSTDEFLKVVWASRNCGIFIDEAGDAVGRYDVVMSKTATRGRHWGHNMHYVSQDAVQLAPVVRKQCSQLYLFAISKSSAKVLADEWNNDALLGASGLPKGHFFFCTRFGVIQRGKLWSDSNHDLGQDSRTSGAGRGANTATARPTSQLAPSSGGTGTDSRADPGAGTDPRADSGADPAS